MIATGEPRTPVTVVTGPGQTGKAMLLGRLGRDPALARTVIMAVDLGGRFAADQPLADDVGLPSGVGCVCCTVQGDLQRTLRALLPKARRGDVSHVIVDASARSDAMSILATVINDPVLAAVYRIGGVVAVVDEAGVAMPKAHRQLIVADRIVVTAGAAAEKAVRTLNPAAHIADSMAAPNFILEENRFAPPATGSTGPSSVLDVTVSDPLDWASFNRWLTTDLLSSSATSRLGGAPMRVTGVLRLTQEDRPVAIDTVRHHVAAPRLLSAWPAGEAPHSRLVFVGDGLDHASIQAALAGLVAR